MASPAILALQAFLEEHDRRVPVGWIGERVHGGERKVLLEAIEWVRAAEMPVGHPWKRWPEVD